MNYNTLIELSNLLCAAKPAFEIAHYYGELPNLTNELNRQMDANYMSVQNLLRPMAEVTSNAIMSNEAMKCQVNFAELSQKLMAVAKQQGLLIDIIVKDCSRMIFSIAFLKGEEIVAEICA